MSGLTLGTVIAEASVRSGARVQARRALAHGRPVFLMPTLVNQPWAAELASRPGLYTLIRSKSRDCQARSRLRSGIGIRPERRNVVRVDAGEPSRGDDAARHRRQVRALAKSSAGTML